MCAGGGLFPLSESFDPVRVTCPFPVLDSFGCASRNMFTESRGERMRHTPPPLCPSGASPLRRIAPGELGECPSPSFPLSLPPCTVRCVILCMSACVFLKCVAVEGTVLRRLHPRAILCPLPPPAVTRPTPQSVSCVTVMRCAPPET